jgi:urease accessory protein
MLSGRSGAFPGNNYVELAIMRIFAPRFPALQVGSAVRFMFMECRPDILLHLLRLVSPTLPTGAFSYSRGLEAAVHQGWVGNEKEVAQWIFGILRDSYAFLDGPLFVRMISALDQSDLERFMALDQWLDASRESHELQMEDRQLGDSLLRLLLDLDAENAIRLRGERLTFAGGFALAAHHWHIGSDMGLHGLFWIVVESQVQAALRLIPLGQIAGQRLLVKSVEHIEACAQTAASLPESEIGNAMIGLAMASAWHENQYSRIFRS